MGETSASPQQVEHLHWVKVQAAVPIKPHRFNNSAAPEVMQYSLHDLFLFFFLPYKQLLQVQQKCSHDSLLVFQISLSVKVAEDGLNPFGTSLSSALIVQLIIESQLDSCGM